MIIDVKGEILFLRIGLHIIQCPRVFLGVGFVH